MVAVAWPSGVLLAIGVFDATGEPEACSVWTAAVYRAFSVAKGSGVLGAGAPILQARPTSSRIRGITSNLPLDFILPPKNAGCGARIGLATGFRNKTLILL